MGRALAAAFGGSVSVVTVVAAVGIAVVTSTPAPVAATGGAAHPVATPAPTASVAAAQTLDTHFAQGLATSLKQGIAELQSYAVAPKPKAAPAVFNADAMAAGFADGAYRFTASIVGFADLSTLGSVVNGTVSDPTHFTLEFPESTTITKYVRDNTTAFAWIEGHRLTLAADKSGVFGTISPEDLLPGKLWTMAVAQWADTLKPDSVLGEYSAPSAALTAKARTGGYAAQDWTLKARLDESGRLTQLGFAGSSFEVPFGLDITVAYG